MYAQVAGEHGFHVSADKLNAGFKTAWGARADFRHRRLDWAQLVDVTFGDLVPPGACTTFFDDVYARFGEPEAWHVFDDVRPTLSALRERRIKLGVISNWDERLRPLLDKLGLHDWFDVIVISHEAESMKPAKEIFLRAADQLDVPPGEILHVGDSVSEDVAGAKAAGMEAFWLNRDTGSLTQLL